MCEAVLKGKLLKVTDTSSKLLPELRQMATELGIPDAATMRKSELVEAIDQRGNGGNKSMTTNSDIPEDDVIEEFREENDTRVERDDRNSDDRGTYNREDRGSYNRNDRGNDDRGGYRRNDRNDRNGRNDRNDRNGDSGSRSRFRERGSRRERDDFEIKEVHFGFRPTVKDRRPILGKHSQHHNFYVFMLLSFCTFNFKSESGTCLIVFKL